MSLVNRSTIYNFPFLCVLTTFSLINMYCIDNKNFKEHYSEKKSKAFCFNLFTGNVIFPRLFLPCLENMKTIAMGF